MAGAQTLCVGLGWGWDGDFSAPDTGLFWLVPPSRYHSLWCLCWGQSCKNHVQCECIIFLGETAKSSTLPSPPYSLTLSALLSNFLLSFLVVCCDRAFSALCLTGHYLLFPAPGNVHTLTISTPQHPAAWSHADCISHIPAFSPIFSCSCGQRPRLVHTLLFLLWCGWHFPSFLRLLGWAVKSTDAENLHGCVSLFSLGKSASHKIYIYISMLAEAWS